MLCADQPLPDGVVDLEDVGGRGSVAWPTKLAGAYLGQEHLVRQAGDGQLGIVVQAEWVVLEVGDRFSEPVWRVGVHGRVA